MLLSRTVLIVGSVLVTSFAVGVFGATMVRALFFAPEGVAREDAVVAAPPLPSAPDPLVPEPEVGDVDTLPTRLRIPRLALDAHVQHVGVTANGAMATPSNFSDVAWYKGGPVPGERGSAVIAGHVNNGLGLAGVFEQLRTVEPGDTVVIVQGDGSEIYFTVTAIRTYRYDDAPLSSIFNTSDGSRLNLITCGGVWLPAEKTYDERLVVYTTRTA